MIIFANTGNTQQRCLSFLFVGFMSQFARKLKKLTHTTKTSRTGSQNKKFKGSNILYLPDFIGKNVNLKFKQHYSVHGFLKYIFLMAIIELIKSADTRRRTDKYFSLDVVRLPWITVRQLPVFRQRTSHSCSSPPYSSSPSSILHSYCGLPWLAERQGCGRGSSWSCW